MIFLLGVRKEKVYPHKDLYTNIHSNFIDNNQKVEMIPKFNRTASECKVINK